MLVLVPAQLGRRPPGDEPALALLALLAHAAAGLLALLLAVSFLGYCSFLLLLLLLLLALLQLRVLHGILVRGDLVRLHRLQVHVRSGNFDQTKALEVHRRTRLPRG